MSISELAIRDTPFIGAAHDIRGLMAVALLAAEQLGQHKDEHVARLADRIEKAIERTVDVCESELTKDTNRARMLHVHSSQCVGRILDHVSSVISSPIIPKDVNFSFNWSVESGIELECSTLSLFRVLFNLVENAVKAIRAHGGTRVDVSVTRAEDDVVITITDDGPGLPPHILHRFFPHFGIRPVRTGRIGRGLGIAQGLTIEMGGKLTLLQTSDDGTAFQLALPGKVSLKTCEGQDPCRKTCDKNCATRDRVAGVQYQSSKRARGASRKMSDLKLPLKEKLTMNI